MTENQNYIILKTIAHVKGALLGAEAGHDWFHIERVWKTAKHIAQTEPVDSFVVELGALLHDIADSKFHGGDETVGPREARAFLESLGAEESVVAHVENIVAHISFKGGNHGQAFRSPELDVVQDADRLDALGAIGIARTLMWGGAKGKLLYDAAEPLPQTRPPDDARSIIDHFYTKLLRLAGMMQTNTGRREAERRTELMRAYLAELGRELSAGPDTGLV